MDIVNVVVGYNFFEKYTLPMIESMQKYNPEIPVVLVDNGSEPPYPEVEGITQVTHDNSSLAGAMNKGVNAAGVHDWYLITNNDMLIEAPLEFGSLDENCIYGAETVTRLEIRYIVAYWILIPRKIWNDVGEFDTGYKHYTYEDVDYCYRVQQAGYEMRTKELPLKHFLHGSLPLNPDINRYRKDNIAYIKNKFSLPEHLH